MATLLQQNPYQCDQCGAPNIVAVPLIYEQGTRTYSGAFHRGSSQSYSAQAAAPPRPRGYMRPLLVWGFAICFAFFWAFAGFSALLKHPTSSAVLEFPIALLLLLGLVFLAGMVLNLRRVTRYNRETYPRLHWNWEHTYMCRRCGSARLMSS